MQNLFESIGLSAKEAEIYQAVLKLGECPVSDILDETQDHPQIVYRGLDALVAKKLIFVIYKRHKKYVRAENPKALEKIAEKQLEDIRKQIPNLLALQKSIKESIVRVYKGNEAIRTLDKTAIDSLPEGGTYYNIGSSGMFYEFKDERFQESERKRIKKRVFKKVVTYKSQKEVTLKNNAKFMAFSEFRFLPEKFSAPSSTSIYNNTVAIFIFSGEPLAITIEHPQVAESYRHYFNSLWKAAKDIVKG
jgi:sugar-specific transcriptional regulator TrmB